MTRTATRTRRGSRVPIAALPRDGRPWLRHYDYWVSPRLTYPRRPLSYILDAAAHEVPDHDAIAFMDARLTYAQLADRSRALAIGLSRAGVANGDRVGIMLPNCPQYAIAAFAVLRIGAVIVNINPTYTARELEIVAGDSGLRSLITLDELAAMALDVRQRTDLRTVIVTSKREYAGPAIAPRVITGTVALADMLSAGTGPLPRASIDPDDVAVLQYTGGSTGTPKGAMLTHANVFANVVQTESFLYRSVRPGESRYLMILPYFHAYGFSVGLMRGTWVGALQIMLPRYDVDAALAAIHDFRPTNVPAVPTVFISLLKHPRLGNSGVEKVRTFSTGGAPCPRGVLDEWEQVTGRTLYQGFGLTEASPATHMTPQLAVRKPGTVGVPLPDTDMKIMDLKTGERELPLGKPGELCIAGPQVMKGYWGNAVETGQTLRRDRSGREWLHTGDIASVDRDGFTTIVGRKKHLIIVNGMKVYPCEVEAVLRMHPWVRAAAVSGVPHPVQGEIVAACVVLEQGSGTSTDDLAAHCGRHLAPYKRPRRIDVRDTLPAAAGGRSPHWLLGEEPRRARASM